MITRSFVSTLLLLGAACVAAPAQPHADRPLWGNLKPGPHGVGFRVIHTYDYTRNYVAKTDYQSARATGETARPMMICIWYPARVAARAKPVTLGDYLALSGDELGRDAGLPARREHVESEFRLGPLGPFFPGGVKDEDWRRVMATPTAAVRDAAPAPGKFPLAVHFMLGRMAQSPLIEFLASHGYVVVAVPLVGRSAAFWNRGEWSFTSLDAMSADIAFSLGEILKLPFADGNRVALIGAGTTPNLLYQMRSLRADAIAAIEGDVLASFARHPSWDAAKIRVPILEVRSKDSPPSSALMTGLPYSQRYLYLFPNMTHLDSYPFQRFARPETAASHKTYEWSCLLVLNFLNSALKGDRAAEALLRAPEKLGIPASELQAQFIEPRAPVPTEDEFLTLIRQNKMEEAARVIKDVRQREPEYRLTTAETMRNVCVFVQREFGLPRAIAAYQLMGELFAANGRIQSEVAAFFAQAGENALAVAHYQRSLDLLEADKNMTEAVKAPLRESLRQQITRLRPPS